MPVSFNRPFLGCYNPAAMQLDLPECLVGLCTREAYLHWLDTRADAHVKRDRKRSLPGCDAASYRFRIHEAVVAGGSHDYYTGLSLDWSLICTYNNKLAQDGGSEYLRKFANMPTVDHEFQIDGKQFRFVICSWRVNDAKTHLTEQEFRELCKQVLDHQGKSKTKEATA
jgi:hypothetical protein